jgi:hypothetical protein
MNMEAEHARQYYVQNVISSLSVTNIVTVRHFETVSYKCVKKNVPTYVIRVYHYLTTTMMTVMMITVWGIYNCK